MTDVRFFSDGYTIAGTYTEVPSPVAAALLITGSGRINRDSDAMLRRTGDYLRAGMTENLADARAGLRWLAGRAAGLPLLTVGHSEGTLHAGQLAAEPGETAVAGTILLAAPARTGEQVIDWQIGKIAPTLPRAVTAIMRVTGSDFTRTQHKRLARLKASSGDVIRMQGIRVSARWFREFLGYDPAADHARITVPVLAITGGHDMQVPPDDVDAIGGLVRGPFEGHVVDDLSHLLRPDPRWAGPRGYRRAVRQPVSPKALSIITSWVTGRWSGVGPGSDREGVLR